MKSVYVCEKCGFMSDDWDTVRACEDNHAEINISKLYTAEIGKKVTYEVGKPLPVEIVLPLEVYDRDTGEMIQHYAKYKLAGGLKKDELAELEKSIADREQREEEQREAWRKEREEKEAAAAE